jgi:hypothetical protein
MRKPLNKSRRECRRGLEILQHISPHVEILDCPVPRTPLDENFVPHHLTEAGDDPNDCGVLPPLGKESASRYGGHFYCPSNQGMGTVYVYPYICFQRKLPVTD